MSSGLSDLPPTPRLGDAPSGEAPRQIGGYEILEALARGGMGVVYRALDPKLKREVALKVLPGGAFSSEEAQRRFLLEAKLLATLTHPGIVPIHDMGMDRGSLFYTMEFIQGETLDAYVRRLGLDLRDRVRLFLKVCESVAHAHAKGVVHRDLKPGNILVRPTGNPVVLDFGIAMLMREKSAPASPSSPGSVLGTPQYMAPEQALGRMGEVGVRSDVYALGVCLYQMLAGRLPFEEEDPKRLLQALALREPPRPSRFVEGLDRDLEAVLLKSLAKQPSLRYDSVQAFARDLKRYLAGVPVKAHPDTLRYRAAKWFRRRREIAGVLVAAAVLTCAAVGVSWHFYREARDAKAALRAYEKALEGKGMEGKAK